MPEYCRETVCYIRFVTGLLLSDGGGLAESDLQ